jgi:hypothetical protein
MKNCEWKNESPKNKKLNGKTRFQKPKTKKSKFWMHKSSSKNHKLEITNEKTKNHFECKIQNCECGQLHA